MKHLIVKSHFVDIDLIDTEAKVDKIVRMVFKNYREVIKRHWRCYYGRAKSEAPNGFYLKVEIEEVITQ